MEDPAFRMLQFVSTQFRDSIISSLMKENKDLAKENAKLKLKLFFKEHKYAKLKILQEKANKRIRTLRCNCIECCSYNNLWQGHEDPHKDCAFKTWFKSKLAASGLTCTHVREDETFAWFVSGKQHKIYAADTDFVELRHHVGDDCISKFIYGPKILNAGSVEDEALKKLEALFIAMDREIETSMYIL